ncbi:hypothetical protein [Devosia nitrariae]|nr:hypothetical protein [Devosia nitrariae]
MADLIQTSKSAEKAVDIETDAYDEPRVLLKLGRLPPGLME